MSCKREVPREIFFSPVEERVEGVRILYYDSGEVKGILRASVIERFTGDTLVMEFRDGFELTLKESDTFTVTIKAKYGRYDEKNGIISARGDVFISTSDGQWLRTEELYYDMHTKQYYTHKFIQLRTHKEMLSGIGFKASSDLSEYEIGEITGKVVIEEFQKQ